VEERGLAATRASAAAQVFVADPAFPKVEPEDRHHLVSVLRLRPGELVVAADGGGRWGLCRFRGGSGDLLEADGPVVFEPAPLPALTIAFAPAKGDRPEWVVQKLTELGIDRIVPLSTARSVVRWEGDRADRAVERLRRVAREAAGQSRRVWIPEVTAVQALPVLVEAAHGCVSLAQMGGSPPTRHSTVVAVGPEGGWAPAEIEPGWRTFGLGPHVLRAETAAVAAAAIMDALRAGTVLGGNRE